MNTRLLLSSALLGLALNPAHADLRERPVLDTALTPVVDASILDQAPFDGLGDTDGIVQDLALSVGLNSRVLDRRVVVEFDLTQVPRRKRVQSALLRIQVLGLAFLPGTTIAPIQVFGYRGDGSIQVDDFNEGRFLTVYDGLAAPNGTSFDLDVTDFVRRLGRNRAHYIGFSFRTNVHGFFRTYGSLATDQPMTLLVTSGSK
jgi:hypothetical protein